FFFQAEDGIRDKLVTGVQTCALPIFLGRYPHSGIHHGDFNARGTPGNAYRDAAQRVARNFARVLGVAYEIHEYLQDLVLVDGNRSEERRVGKECRCRWWV